MKRLVVATRNPGKILEIEAIASHFPVLKTIPVYKLEPEFHVEEDGKTYEENAIKKALRAACLTDGLAVADDSGLEVDALDGAPGLYSARFGGVALSQTEKNQLLLQKLQGVSRRSARFRCVIALASPAGDFAISEGICEGYIGTQEQGENGFGFDPIFVMPEYGKTMAELEPAVKNMVSHRAKALQRLPELLNRFLNT